MICLLHTLFSVFPIDANQSLYCPFADSVLHILITPGPIYSFSIYVYISMSQKNPFLMKDLTLFVAEGSALCCPAPALCSKCASVEINKSITPVKWQ